MPIWLRICEAIMIISYALLAIVLTYIFSIDTVIGNILFGIGYGIFIIISLGYILNSLPKRISKYFRNDYNSKTS